MEAAVAEGARKVPVPHHAAHVQILEADHGMGPDNARRKLMQVIAPDCSDPSSFAKQNRTLVRSCCIACGCNTRHRLREPAIIVVPSGHPPIIQILNRLGLDHPSDLWMKDVATASSPNMDPQVAIPPVDHQEHHATSRIGREAVGAHAADRSRA
jgi:hypothetical protein